MRRFASTRITSVAIGRWAERPEETQWIPRFLTILTRSYSGFLPPKGFERQAFP
jgi:hypothetical protein